MAEEERIKVVVRVRDLIPREKGEAKVFSVMDSDQIVRKGTDKSWTFDRVYSPLENNRAVYADTVGPMIEDTINGFNSTIFAYGQTSSGKTHTMYGCRGEEGVIDMAVNQLFYAMEETPNRKFLVMASFIEIYNESVVDLLADPTIRPQGGLKIRENGDGEVYVENIEEKIVASQDDIYNYMKEGEKSRKVGATNMNERSSRSHTIFRLRIESSNRVSDETMTEEEEDEGEQIMVSQLNLVDLAGSERAAQTGAGGTRLKEGCNINQSLMTLGQVIQKLSSAGNQHIPYRDSKLTRILQNSLGGNAKTAIICTVTPAAMSEEQTFSTLRFASEAKKITNHAKVNEILDHQGQISKMKKEMEELKRELLAQKKVNTNEMVEELKEKLEREKIEKESKMKEIESLQLKIITSSQPAPPRKSMMFLQSRKTRRETWCGPNLKRAMRQSYAPTAASRALPDLENTLSNSTSSSSSSFKFSPSGFQEHLNSEENKRLEEFEESETSWLKCTPSPVVRKKRKTVGFVQSPQFLSPGKFRKPISDLNCTDDGATPRAVIRDKYKRVSLALSDREVELERERQERLELETELQELQEFTRLEDEAGVLDDLKGRNNEVFETTEQMRTLEKSCQDSEKIIIDLRKTLQEKKEDNVALSSRLENIEEKFEKVTEREKLLSARVEELEPLVSKVKVLTEKSDALERNKEDFDMEMELALKKKETLIEDLKKYLESAYEEIALNENSNKDQVKKRHVKLEETQKEIEDLKEQLRLKEKEMVAPTLTILDTEKDKTPVQSQQTQTEEESEKCKSDEDVRKSEGYEEVIKEKTNAIEDLKLSFEEQSRENEDALKEIEKLKKENDSLRESLEKNNSGADLARQQFLDFQTKLSETCQKESQLQKEYDEVSSKLALLSEEKENFEEKMISMSSDLSLVREENATLKKGLDEQVAVLEEALEEKGKLERELAALHEAQSENKESLQGHADAIKEKETTIDDLKLCIEEQSKENEDVAIELKKFQDENASLREVYEEKVSEIERTLAEKENLKREVAMLSQTNSENEEELQGLVQSNSSYENALTESKNLISERDLTISELEERVSRLNKELENLQSTISTSGERRKTLEAEKSSLLADQQDVLKDLEESRLKNDQMDTKIKSLEEVNSRSEAALKDLAGKMMSLDEELSELKVDLENSYKVKENLSSENRELLQQISTLKQKNEDSESKLLEETALKQQIEGQNLKLLEDLENLKLSNSSASSSQIELYQEIQMELSRTAQENLRLQEQLAESASEIIKVQKQLTEANSGFCSVEEEREKLQEKLMKTTSDLTFVSGEKENLDEELRKVNSQLESVIQEKESLNDDLSKNFFQLATVNKEKEDLQLEVKQITCNLSSVAQEKECLDEKLSKMSNELSSVSQAKQQLEEELARVTSDFSSVHHKEENLMCELSKLSSDLVSANEEKEKLRDELSLVTSEVSSAKLENEKVQEELSRKTSELLTLKLENENVQEELSKKIAEMSTLKLENMKVQEELSQKISELSTLGREKNDILGQMSVLSSDHEATATRHLDEKKRIDGTIQELVDQIKVLEKRSAEAEVKMSEKEVKIRELKFQNEECLKEVDKVKFFLTEAESQRDKVDEVCDQLEAELEENKKRMAVTESQVIGLKAENEALVNKVEDKKESFILVEELRSTTKVQLEEIENLKFFLKEAQDQNDEANEACDKAEEELEEKKTEMRRLEEMNNSLKGKLIQAEEENSSGEHQKKVNQLTEALAAAKEKLGERNIELASLKVDVERGELEYKKKCEILQADLDYEKSNNTRLTMEIRRQQSSSLDTSQLGGARARSGPPLRPQPETEPSEPPVWNSGSGALKEMRLYEMESKVKSLEKDNARLKDHEEFYINKAREWKNRALKHERLLKEKGITVPSRDNKAAAAANKENHANSGASSLEAQEEAKMVQAPSSPTIHLDLNQPREPRRTEEDFRLPESSGRQEQCKTQ